MPVDLAQVDAAVDRVHAADLGEHVAGHAIWDDTVSAPAAAVGGVGHAFAFEQADVFWVDGHGGVRPRFRSGARW
ncbi:hypothetical protein D3C72_2488340 [compost metagenome]